jgi:hypothetical protein
VDARCAAEREAGERKRWRKWEFVPHKLGDLQKLQVQRLGFSDKTATHSLQIPSEAHSSLDRAITCGFGEVLMPVELGGRLQQQPTRLRTVM